MIWDAFKKGHLFKLNKKESKGKGQVNHLQGYNLKFIFWSATQLSKVRPVTHFMGKSGSLSLEVIILNCSNMMLRLAKYPKAGQLSRPISKDYTPT